ncbi:DUF3923 family protein [Macrococcus armenti]|uniref:DUF3923 family protein n=1 Tax=Macrococcus armenti TaxID=2875764 RepID=UPI001CCFCB84|nr:DUF3923 family protein [Macrococcus armenti]UBH14412.1 DUF3923 family protein [Macrococcus armenti]UBH16772.1 DUF3923 family protein [Macrococcus armenti]UBH19035.1 DUF3923 family protein [Macrococcus armenti]
MRISWTLWWLVSTLEFLSFIGMLIFLWLREIDGSGAVQTTEIKLINIGVLALFYIIPFVIQLIWLVLNLINSNKKAQNLANH